MEINLVPLSTLTEKYLLFCTTIKNLFYKTTKSYSIDLRQYAEFICNKTLPWDDKKSIESYIEFMHSKYKPKSIKRKIVSLKAFFHYLETEELMEFNPFHKIQRIFSSFVLAKTFRCIFFLSAPVGEYFPAQRFSLT